MGIIDKVKAMKDVIVENAEEYAVIKDMNADQIAERYGYQKLLSYIRKELLLSREQQVIIVDGDEETVVEPDPVLIRFNYAKNDNKKIVILEEGFGEKETYNLDIIKFMLKKYNAEVNVGTIEEDAGLIIRMLPKKAPIEDRLEDIYANRYEYLDIVKDKASNVKKAAGNVTKKTLNNLADWANKNL